MIFRDRLQAGEKLADALMKWRGSNPLVLAIPRGAVPMGKVVADRLGGQLDVVLTRKLAAPGNPEFAIGAVDETGWTYLADYAEQAGATAEYIDAAVAQELETMRRRRLEYAPGAVPRDPAGRVVIVIDDGLATGATMIAALHALRARAPAHLICAVPVASQDALSKVRPYADELVCLHAPAFFLAVARFYERFPQVSDAEVAELLRASAPPRTSQSEMSERDTAD